MVSKLSELKLKVANLPNGIAKSVFPNSSKIDVGAKFSQSTGGFVM